MLSPLRFLLVRLGFLCSAGLALLSLAAATPAASAAAADSRQLLLIHDDAKVTEPLVAFLKAKGGFETLVVDQAHLPEGDWSGYRAVLGYVHGRLQEAAEVKIIDYTKKGGRFVALHHMISSGKASNKYYFEFLGIQLDNPSASSSPVLPGAGYGWYTGGEGEPGVKVTLVKLHPTHFIVTHDVEWGPPVKYQSSDTLAVAKEYPAIVVPQAEAYMNHKFTDGREKTVLIGFQYTDPRNHAFFEQDRTAWFKSYGAGMIFYFQSGHFSQEYQNPNISQMILNAIIWDGR